MNTDGQPPRNQFAVKIIHMTAVFDFSNYTGNRIAKPFPAIGLLNFTTIFSAARGTNDKIRGVNSLLVIIF
jgi:hypothetical protein